MTHDEGSMITPREYDYWKSIYRELVLLPDWSELSAGSRANKLRWCALRSQASLLLFDSCRVVQVELEGFKPTSFCSIKLVDVCGLRHQLLPIPNRAERELPAQGPFAQRWVRHR